VIVRIGIDVRVPHVVVLRIVAEIVDQPVAVVVAHGASVNLYASTPESTVWLPEGRR